MFFTHVSGTRVMSMPQCTELCTAGVQAVAGQICNLWADLERIEVPSATEGNKGKQFCGLTIQLQPPRRMHRDSPPKMCPQCCNEWALFGASRY